MSGHATYFESGMDEFFDQHPTDKRKITCKKCKHEYFYHKALQHHKACSNLESRLNTRTSRARQEQRLENVDDDHNNDDNKDIQDSTIKKVHSDDDTGEKALINQVTRKILEKANARFPNTSAGKRDQRSQLRDVIGGPITGLFKKIYDLGVELADLQAKYDEAIAANRHLTKENMDLKDEIEAKERKINELAEKINGLEQEVEDIKEEQSKNMDTLKEELNSKQQQCMSEQEAKMKEHMSNVQKDLMKFIQDNFSNGLSFQPGCSLSSE